jgi:hypothetical protein
MTAPDPEPEWVAALIERTVAEMPDDVFDALVARTRAPKVPAGNHVPGVGNSPGGTPTDVAAIAAAEAAGDWQRSFALKSQQLSKLMRKRT